MAELMWCPNCEQKVGAQRKTSNLGCVFVVMIGVAIALALFMPALGLLVAGSAAILFVVGLVWELVDKAAPDSPLCPLCKADNLKPL